VVMQRQMEQDELKKRKELEHKKTVINQAEERHRHEREDDVDDSEVVDQIFGFLPGNNDSPSGKAPKAFGDLAVAQQQYILSDSSTELPGETVEDLKEYRFERFAATYFQGQNTPVFVNQKLHRPLLYHEETTDNMVNICSRHYIANLLSYLDQILGPLRVRDSGKSTPSGKNGRKSSL